MAIFMPSQVTPDVRNGLGAGTVDVNNGLTVSWHINGSSALTAFSISIMRNDATSAVLYDTGIKTDGCPAYGTDSSGNPLFFSYTISAAKLMNALIFNENEYKLVITQWWSASESVTQSSASVFLARETPSLTIDPIGTGGIVGARTYTFTGSYSQADGDILNWFRWRVASVANGEYTVLQDSGDVSGTMDVSCEYDGFFTGNDYAVRLNAQTENGVEADTGWVDFSVQYETIDLQNVVTVACASGTDAVEIEWSDIDVIPGWVTGGEISFPDGDNPPVFLPEGTRINWNTVGTKPMSFDAPWSVVWKGTLGYADAECFIITMADGSIVRLLYYIGNHSLTFSYESDTVTTQVQTGIINAPTVTAVLTPATLYLRVEYLTGGLYPADNLYPSDTLYPSDDTVSTVDTYTIPVTYTQDAISMVQIGGEQQCWYIEVIKGTASSSMITNAITNGDYVPGSYDDDYMMAGFENETIDAGTVQVPDNVIGWAVYRRQGSEGAFQKIAETDLLVGKIFDYSAASQQGAYTYFVFPLGEKTFITTGVASQPISPCWWNWTLMECAETGIENLYSVLAAYRFRLNISTGAVSNGNSPSLLLNFTPYPKVQLAPQNYRSGTLTALIGAIDWTSGQPDYKDSIALMQKIMALSVTRNALFLKNRKGELIRIRISGAIQMQTEDATRQQMQTVTIPWAEVGSADGVGLFSAGSGA